MCCQMFSVRGCDLLVGKAAVLSIIIMDPCGVLAAPTGRNDQFSIKRITSQKNGASDFFQADIRTALVEFALNIGPKMVMSDPDYGIVMLCMYKHQ